MQMDKQALVCPLISKWCQIWFGKIWESRYFSREAHALPDNWYQNWIKDLVNSTLYLKRGILTPP